MYGSEQVYPIFSHLLCNKRSGLFISKKTTSFQYFNWIIAYASLKTRLSLHQDLESIQEITASGAVVFQSPRVKSGNSTGMPPWAMEWAVSGSREDQAAPS